MAEPPGRGRRRRVDTAGASVPASPTGCASSTPLDESAVPDDLTVTLLEHVPADRARSTGRSAGSTRGRVGARPFAVAPLPGRATGRGGRPVNRWVAPARRARSSAWRCCARGHGPRRVAAGRRRTTRRGALRPHGRGRRSRVASARRHRGGLGAGADDRRQVRVGAAQPGVWIVVQYTVTAERENAAIGYFGSCATAKAGCGRWPTAATRTPVLPRRRASATAAWPSSRSRPTRCRACGCGCAQRGAALRHVADVDLGLTADDAKRFDDVTGLEVPVDDARGTLMRWRWWAVLPVAVVLVLVATASRLQIFWWPNELHDETAGRQGEPVARGRPVDRRGRRRARAPLHGDAGRRAPGDDRRRVRRAGADRAARRGGGLGDRARVRRRPGRADGRSATSR